MKTMKIISWAPPPPPPRLRTLSEGGVIGEELRTVYILAYTLLSHFSLYVKKHLKFLLTYSKIDFFWVIL